GLAGRTPAPMRLTSIRVLPYWFESQTYGVRPEKKPPPPRTWRLPSPFTSQLKPTRGENIHGLGATSVAKPKACSAAGFAVGLSGKDGLSTRTPRGRVGWGAALQTSRTE